tara:strand:- start:25 stop:225 length:201 start_codon:yes stop_codon:yes gene_type:complete
LGFCGLPPFVDGDIESDLQSDQEEMARASVVLAEEIMTTEQESYFRRLKHFFIKQLFDHAISTVFT